MTVTISDWMEELDLGKRGTPEFFRTFGEVDEFAPRMYAHAMRRAWQELRLDGIYCIDGTPVVYIKEVETVDASELLRLHCLLWNNGIAPILLVISPSDVSVYSGLALPAARASKIGKSDILADVFNRVAQTLEIRNLLLSIELGEFFQNHSKSFDPKLRVDRYLLDNLNHARHLLRSGSYVLQDTRTVDALLCRTIFTCYLTDRAVIGPAYFAEIGAGSATSILEILNENNPEDAGDLLYVLFEKLKRDFNGDLFDVDLELERQRVTTNHIDALRRFLSGDKLDAGQRTLGFWVYNFSIIPIETISAIYESFLEAEDSEEKKSVGAFYTPRFLAEIAIDTALEGWNTILDKRFLDPACGSGIFLVSLFNRLAEEWRHRHPKAGNRERFEALVQILCNRLFGIDAKETACRIAAFSLYLALLDQLDPRDIQELQKRGGWLPRLVGSTSKPDEDGWVPTILHGNFFKSKFTLPHSDFDLILGNPPWAPGKIGSQLDVWISEAERTIPQRQLAYGFMWRANDFVKRGGRICFLLPASLLFNRAKNVLEFQREWLETFAVDRILNLSDMSFFLFDNAARPALIVRYRPGPRDDGGSVIEYQVPKTDLPTIYADLLSISPDDQVEIVLEDVLSDLRSGRIPVVWKQAMWGTPRDRKLLERLSDLPSLSELAGGRYSNKRWFIGQGFKPYTESSEQQISRPWADDTLMREAKPGLDLLMLPGDCSPLGDRYRSLGRLPDSRVFTSPRVIVAQGFKAAFADFDMVFRSSLQGIHGPVEDTELLMFLAGVMNSPLATYFLFHTAGYWGTERDKVLETELLLLPLPLPDSMVDPDDAWQIIQQVATDMKSATEECRKNFLARSAIVERTRQQIYPHICRYYGIGKEEQILIRDTLNVWEPSSTPSRGARSIATLVRSSEPQREEYLKVLCTTLNNWTSGGDYEIVGEVIVPRNSDLGLVQLSRVRRGDVRPIGQEISDPLGMAMQRIREAASEKHGRVNYSRDIKLFIGEQLFTLKPLSFRFWTKTTALNDADEIASAILSARKA